MYFGIIVVGCMKSDFIYDFYIDYIEWICWMGILIFLGLCVIIEIDDWKGYLIYKGWVDKCIIEYVFFNDCLFVFDEKGMLLISKEFVVYLEKWWDMGILWFICVFGFVEGYGEFIRERVYDMFLFGFVIWLYLLVRVMFVE